MNDFSKEIRAYVLKNAVEHKGKAVAGSVLSALFNLGLDKKDIKEIMPLIEKTLEEINSLSLDKQKAEFKKYEDIISRRAEREGLPELPNVKKTGVVMRFSPAPSGPLHIGHALTGMPSSLYVEKYGGKFYVRIEDTNPENIYPPAYKLIKRESDWLFGNVSEYIIQSDRMKIYYEYLMKLIGKGAVYVCTCDAEEFKSLVAEKKACPCREVSKKETKRLWEKMLDEKGFKDGEAVVRFKADLNDPNPAMRDFPLARINTTKHPRQGKKYRVWPLMNLAVTIDDIEYKMTHIIRAKEHKDNAKRQKMIYDVLKKKFPVTLFLGRYHFKDLELSTSKTRKAIEEGKYSGWDDPRLPFIASLKKRKYKPEAFKMMAIERGISEVDKVMSREDFFVLLDKFNEKAKKE